MYNKVILMGRITRDIEIKTTPSGKAVTSFSIAVDRRIQSKDGEKVTDFIDCVAWRQIADFIARFFSKGKLILIEGELQTRTYTDKNGINRKAVEVIVDRASFTGEKAGAQEQRPEQSAPPEQYEQLPAESTGDDYPF
jgi:single-strand DNA-binding protein